MDLKPCPYRQVTDEGHILCDKIKSGDREVSPAICRVCPVAQIDCAHLRATLANQVRPPLTVRYGNGKTEIWDDPGPPIALERAACSAKVIPILSSRDCAGCPIRQALASDDNQTKHTRRKTNAAIRAPMAQTQTNTATRKIILLQEWLAKQKNLSRPIQGDEDDSAVRPIVVRGGHGVVVPRNEEKHVGWTD